MSDYLKGKRVAILLANGFEQLEMTEPRKALENAGALVASRLSREVAGRKQSRPRAVQQTEVTHARYATRFRGSGE
jgi:protease I